MAAPDIDVVGVAYNGYQAVEQIQKARPDVVLIDLKARGMNGQETQLIHDHYPQARILVLTTAESDERLFLAIRSGASGYLLKNIEPSALIKAIKGTARGKTYVDPEVAGKLFTYIAQHASPRQDSTITDSLRSREREILRLLARGLSNNRIARQLHLSEGTVRNYVSSIIAKLNVSDRTQAAVLALQHGLVDLREAR